MSPPVDVLVDVHAAPGAGGAGGAAAVAASPGSQGGGGAGRQPRGAALDAISVEPAALTPSPGPGAGAASGPAGSPPRTPRSPPRARRHSSAAAPAVHRRSSIPANTRRDSIPEEAETDAHPRTPGAPSACQSRPSSAALTNGHRLSTATIAFIDANPSPSASCGRPLSTASAADVVLSPCTSPPSTPSPPMSMAVPTLTPGTSPSTCRKPAAAPSSGGDGVADVQPKTAEAAAAAAAAGGDCLLGAFGVPFFFPPASIPLRQEQEEQQARLGEWTLDLNSQIATFRELILCIGGPRDSQQLREEVRKCRIYTMELCRQAKPLIQASYKWQTTTNWNHTMTPPSMWCEFMKMFDRLLELCLVLVQEFPADMSGYEGGALSKLLVQSLRPEWNKQELASVAQDREEVAEMVAATGADTSESDQLMESSSALRARPPRRRSALSFIMCCSRARSRSPPPSEAPGDEAEAEAEADEAPASAAAPPPPPRSPRTTRPATATTDNNNTTNNNNDVDPPEPPDPPPTEGPSPAEPPEPAEPAAYDPCTPWDSM